MPRPLLSKSLCPRLLLKKKKKKKRKKGKGKVAYSYIVTPFIDIEIC